MSGVLFTGFVQVSEPQQYSLKLSNNFSASLRKTLKHVPTTSKQYPKHIPNTCPKPPNNTSKKLESKLVFRNSLIDSRNSFQNDLKILKEKQYKEIDLFEKSYKILEKEKKKNVTRKDHFINKIKKCEESITSLSSEIDSFSDLLNLNNSIYNCLKIFKNKLFDLDLSAKIIDNNNNDRSHEIKLDGYIKTFNWSIDDLKKKRNIYDDFEKKINDNNQNIFKELEEIKHITNSLIFFPEILVKLNSELVPFN